MNDTRARGILEVITSIMLGLVSVITAAGAYTSAVWGDQASSLSGTAEQLRDRSFASFITTDVAGSLDADLIFEALKVDSELAFDPPNADELRLAQRIALASGTPGLLDEWDRWAEADYDLAYLPGTRAAFAAPPLAETYSYNRASVVAGELAGEYSAKSLWITIASVVFAISLLLFGVSGVNRSFRVALGLAGGGAVAFVVGTVLTVVAMI